MSNATTRWWLVRHAPVPCPHGRIHGQLDVACDTSDDEDFRQLAARVPPQATLVESGLMRCRQTTGALEAAGLVVPPPLVEPDLMEQNFGRWQGRSWMELEAAKDADLDAFWAEPAFAVPPGGESFAALCDRVGAALARLSGPLAGRDVLAVVHAGTVRAALAAALSLPPDIALRFAVQPLSLTRLDLTPEGWRVECVNVTAT
ncbi:Phosphoglycerate/bisphosphoglycerate mutase [Magnetospirillum sp. LM-5]|uniref:histidine phosphatase family protein n=1 Tax=Magnetospirillum sp. LM-5 TaxID=2681466 RepID=UPI001381188F|nr:histidine phosphatase family protein [Magnetospirillum sp. LM-5]CAA7621562.1 Phosphoglycerate/bisphosphoglycerate mutase [Magnetospirillum sp. LM-5]